MERFFVYILHSPSINSFYIGQTLDVDIRQKEHLLHVNEGAHTGRADDWTVYYLIECSSRRQAILIEQHIKRMKSRKYLKNLAEFPDITRKLLDKFP